MSAVLTTLHTAADPLADLVEQLAYAHRAEDAAAKHRIGIEQRIIALHPAREEGSETIPVAGYKVTLTGSMSYKADDIEALRNITAKWDAQFIPLETKTALSGTACKWLRANRPDLWREIAAVVTMKPGKPAVKLAV